jgi:methylenetetrahydrofolate reductase (NADPH)
MPAISFEFFPPKTEEQRTQLDRAAKELKALKPEYV